MDAASRGDKGLPRATEVWLQISTNCVQEDASAKMLGYHVLLSASIVDYVILNINFIFENLIFAVCSL